MVKRNERSTMDTAKRVTVLFPMVGFKVREFEVQAYSEQDETFKMAVEKGIRSENIVESDYFTGSDIDYYFQAQTISEQSLAWRKYQFSCQTF